MSKLVGVLNSYGVKLLYWRMKLGRKGLLMIYRQQHKIKKTYEEREKERSNLKKKERKSPKKLLMQRKENTWLMRK